MIMPDKKQTVIALIPAFNEETRITAVIKGTQQYLPVWVVDDGSVDQTARVASQAGAEVISYMPNRGKGAALRVGFLKALEFGADAVITLDADGQHDPEEIPQFLKTYKLKNPAMIIGARDFSKMPFTRKLANTIGRKLLSWAAGQEIRDNQSGFRLIRRDLMEAMLESEESGFEFEVEMVITCLKRHWALDWVPIRTIYTNQGSHIHPIRHIVNFFRITGKIWREMRH